MNFSIKQYCLLLASFNFMQYAQCIDVLENSQNTRIAFYSFDGQSFKTTNQIGLQNQHTSSHTSAIDNLQSHDDTLIPTNYNTMQTKAVTLISDSLNKDTKKVYPQKYFSLFYIKIPYEATPRNEKILQSFPLIYNKSKLLNPPFDDTMQPTFQDSLNPKSILPIEEWRGNYVMEVYNFAKMYNPNYIRAETKGHISFRIPIVRNALDSGGSLYFAFTNVFFFQLFNETASSPVRDNDFSPEFLYVWPLNVDFLGGKIQEFTTGWRHISNGEVNKENGGAEDKSRGTDRWIFKLIWTHGEFGADLEFFVPTRYYSDNPDIYNYLGIGDLKLFFRHKKHLVDMTIKGLFRIDYSYMKYSSFELSYTYKLNPHFGIYTQYFVGYSDVLYEYNIFAHRIGIGIRTIL